MIDITSKSMHTAQDGHVCVAQRIISSRSRQSYLDTLKGRDTHYESHKKQIKNTFGNNHAPLA